MKFWICFIAVLMIVLGPSPALAQKKNQELANQLATYTGPFEIVWVGAFTTNNCREQQVAITFKMGSKLVTATLKPSSMEIIPEQSTNTTDGDGIVVINPPTNTISFSFNVDMIDPMTWRMLNQPAKFITNNSKAVEAEIHCGEDEIQGKYTPPSE